MGSRKEKVKNFFLILLSHHTEEYYHRTFTISIRGREIHFCARCSGVILSFIGALIYFFFAKLDLDPTFSLIIATILAIPVTIDWGTQKLGYRESRNSIRFSAGALLGIGTSLLKFTFTIYWLTLIVVTTFIVIFFIITIRGY